MTCQKSIGLQREQFLKEICVDLKATERLSAAALHRLINIHFKEQKFRIPIVLLVLSLLTET